MVFHGFPVAGNGSDDSQPTEVNTTIKRFFFLMVLVYIPHEEPQASALSGDCLESISKLCPHWHHHLFSEPGQFF